jgi:hypothetical protein
VPQSPSGARIPPVGCSVNSLTEGDPISTALRQALAGYAASTWSSPTNGDSSSSSNGDSLLIPETLDDKHVLCRFVAVGKHPVDDLPRPRSVWEHQDITDLRFAHLARGAIVPH